MIVSLLLAALACATFAAAGEVKIVDDGTKAIVTVDGQPFTEYRYSGYAKPILYPVLGPGQTPMTRNYPMVEEVDNEASDHPHHKSIWYTHDEVNGVRFWLESEGGKRPDAGTQVKRSLKIVGDSIVTENDWINAKGDVICQDIRTIAFGGSETHRFIDYDVTWVASNGDVHIGDTKEGTMGIRTHPRLRLKTDPKRGNHTAGGHSINSEGVKDGEMWGKRAAWVAYWGEIEGKPRGVAIFDHSENPRHPTWWHARHYGLVAANPFGIHDFEKKPKGTGDLTIKNGETLKFRYRFLFFEGDGQSADVDAWYKAYAGQ